MELILKAVPSLQATRRFYRTEREGTRRQMQLDQGTAKHEERDADRLVGTYRESMRKSLDFMMDIMKDRAAMFIDKYKERYNPYTKKMEMVRKEKAPHPKKGDPKHPASRQYKQAKKRSGKLYYPFQQKMPSKKAPRTLSDINVTMHTQAQAAQQAKMKYPRKGPPGKPDVISGAGVRAYPRRVSPSKPVAGTGKKPPMKKAWGKWGKEKTQDDSMKRTELYPVEYQETEVSKAASGECLAGVLFHDFLSDSKHFLLVLVRLFLGRLQHVGRLRRDGLLDILRLHPGQSEVESLLGETELVLLAPELLVVARHEFTA